MFAGVEQSYASEVTPFPAHALSSDSSDGNPTVSVCVAEKDASKDCICHLEVKWVVTDILQYNLYVGLNL